MLKLVSFEAPSWYPSSDSDAGAVPRPPPSHRVNLGHFPTPIHKLNFPISSPDSKPMPEVYVKRDDMTSFDLGGNKIRKLEFLLAEALKGGHDCVITIGGIQSNHARATAVAARQLGLEPFLILRTPNGSDESDPGLAGNLLLNRLVNAQISLVSQDDYSRLGRDVLLRKLSDELTAKGRQPYIIPMGGSNALGTWGYLTAAEEVVNQCEAEKKTGSGAIPTHFDHIVFGCGSGGTAAGMVFGIHLAQQLKEQEWKSSTKVHGVCVCDDPDYFFDYMDQIGAELGLFKVPGLQSTREICTMYSGQGSGYAQSTAEELQFICDVGASSGVMFDPVYSGKALYHLYRSMLPGIDRGEGVCASSSVQHIFHPDHKILFIHTGGMFGMYDKMDQLMGNTSLSTGEQGPVRKMQL